MRGMQKLLLVSGSAPRGSTNSAALHTAADLLEGATGTVYEALAELPAFNPDDDHDPLPAAVIAMREPVAAPGRGDGADATLRTVLGYVGAQILDSSGTRVPVGHDAVDDAGLVRDG